MAFGLGGTTKLGVPELIAKKKYDKAIELLKEQLKARPDDNSLRLQSADVLVLMGKVDNAIRVLDSVADDFAQQGFAAKAIAVLKKIQKLDPGRRDIERRIVEAFKSAPPPPSTSPGIVDFRLLRPQDIDHQVVSGVSAQHMVDTAPVAPAPPSIYAEFPQSDDLSIGDLVVEPETKATPAPPAPPPPAPEPAVRVSQPAGDPSALLASLAAPDEAPLSSAPADDDLSIFSERRSSPAEAPKARVVSPLFDDFAEDEMIEFIKGLELFTYEPGDIVVTEGEPGDSLFVVTTGVVKAFVRNKQGGNTQVRQLHEGDFFGEISVLSGKPRTATVTAAADCELLRLDRAALDAMSATKPRVREILQKFYDERTRNAAEAEIRGIDLSAARGVFDDEPTARGELLHIDRSTVEAPGASGVTAQNLRKVALEHSRKENWSDAVLAWQQYLALRPDDTGATNVLGILFGKLGRWKEAGEAFERSAEMDPADATVYFNLGLCYANLDLVNESVAAYRKAVELKPDYEKAKHNLQAMMGRMQREVRPAPPHAGA